MSYSNYGTGAYGYEEGGTSGEATGDAQYGGDYGATGTYGAYDGTAAYGNYGDTSTSAYGQEHSTDYHTYGTEYTQGDTGGTYGESTAVPDFSTDSYGASLGGAVSAPLDLQMDSVPVSGYGYEQEQDAAPALQQETFQIPNFDEPDKEEEEAAPGMSEGVPSHESVSKLAGQFGSASINNPLSPTTSSGGPKKWEDPIAKSKKAAPLDTPDKPKAPADPAAIDTTSANVSDVRKMWQQAAQNAPPPMPKTKMGIVLPAAEAVSTVHTVGLMDRSIFSKQAASTGSAVKKTPAPDAAAAVKAAFRAPDSGGSEGGAEKPQSASMKSLERDFPVQPPSGGGESEEAPSGGGGKKPDEKPAQTPQPKAAAAAASPPSVDFSSEQFTELMSQIESGDADQKAYAAMELQTMALDSRSQVLMAQNGAIQPLVKLLMPGDPMVQASAAGALWNLAANEQNKFAIAQAGAIQPLVAMLYSDVREAQLSAAGALQNLCVNASNKKTVAAAGGVEALMMLLSDKDRHVKAKAAGALQSLAVDEENQKKIKSLGAIPLITKLLSSRTPEVQSNAAGALHNLAVNDEEAQEAVAQAGAIPPLIALMQNASPDLQAKAAATIWSIAGREENRKRIMEAGGIAPLVKMIQSNHSDCQSKASGAVRCLTMSAFTRPEFEKAGAIPHLVVLLSSGHQEVTINAAGALENLGCR
eukprot:CAMPEP_0181321760 /NCGR_PEP_ID=MMETSP1101-20121128/18866_1 /TAXON_ID=46948 /ORGANISM="Rhodomonas abbreviata, Strain Caron Lab Isolate" /LENGTH=698 /DNA_ID=CAMNT_0023429627 /DNA_START=165 /DNA_END=2261 /DNA_ORIENTATION=-